MRDLPATFTKDHRDLLHRLNRDGEVTVNQTLVTQAADLVHHGYAVATITPARNIRLTPAGALPR